MSVKLDIIPFSRSVDMFGTAQTSSAYSLSGNVLITITPSTSLLSGNIIRPPSIRLKSLSVIFEGKSESISPLLGYDCARLCRIEKTLVGSSSTNDAQHIAQPMTLNCAGGDPHEKCWQWTVEFDLSIPGWLPPSVTVPEFTETSYTLHAFATLETLDPPSPNRPPGTPTSSSPTSSQSRKMSPVFPSWNLPYLPSLISTSFSRQKQREIEAEPITITVNRVRSPPKFLVHPDTAMGGTARFKPVHRAGTPFLNCETEELAKAAAGAVSDGGIPLQLLCGVDMVTSIPEYIDIQEGAIPLRLGLFCAPDLAEGRTLRFLEAEVQVLQVEEYRSIADDSFTSCFPMPPASEQAPLVPLLSPHPVQALAEFCQAFPSDEKDSRVLGRTRKLIPGERAYLRPAGVTATSNTGGIALDSRWARMDAVIPIDRSVCSLEKECEDDDDEIATRPAHCPVHCACLRVLPKSWTPYSRINHEMKISVKVSWDPSEDVGTNGEAVEASRNDTKSGPRIDYIQYTFPLRFTRVPEDIRTPSSPTPSSSHSILPAEPSIPSSPSSVSSTSPLSSLFSLASSRSSSSPSPSPATSSFKSTILPAYSQLFDDNGERRYDEDQQGFYLPPYSSSEEDTKGTSSGTVYNPPTAIHI